MFDSLAIAGLVISGISAIIAAIAALSAASQLRESKRATQLQVFDATFKELRSLEDRYYLNYAHKPGSSPADGREASIACNPLG